MSRLPKLTTDQEESDFWDTHDATDFFDETFEEDETFVDARQSDTRKPAPEDSQLLDPNP